MEQRDVEGARRMPLLEFGNRADVEVGGARLLLLMSLLNGDVFDRHHSCYAASSFMIAATADRTAAKPDAPRPDVINKPGRVNGPSTAG